MIAVRETFEHEPPPRIVLAVLDRDRDSPPPPCDLNRGRRSGGYASYCDGTRSSTRASLPRDDARPARLPSGLVGRACAAHTPATPPASSPPSAPTPPAARPGRVDGDYDPPAEAIAYTPEELIALDEEDCLLVFGDRDCPRCLVERGGYLANRSPLGGPYFACLTCQRWSEIPVATQPIGRRSRRPRLAE